MLSENALKLLRLIRIMSYDYKGTLGAYALLSGLTISQQEGIRCLNELQDNNYIKDFKKPLSSATIKLVS